MQVCRAPAQMHFSTGHSKLHFSLLSTALQNRPTAGNVPLRLHLWSFALYTGMQ